MRAFWLSFAISLLSADPLHYEWIKEIAESYERPFTVLDLGAGDGSYSFKILEDFPNAVCVMVERNVGLKEKYADNLLTLSETSEKKVILLNKTLTVSDLDHLSKIEHFDIILAIDFLPHLRIPRPYSYEDVLQTLLRMGDHLLISLPIDSRTYIRHIETSPALEKAKEEDLSLLYLLKGETTVTLREEGFDLNENLILTSSLDRKTLQKECPNRSFLFRRQPGISLFTYLFLGGKWPSRELLKKKIEALPWDYYKNISPSNIFLTGEDLEFENLNFSAPPKDPLETKRRLLELFDCKSQKELREKY